MYKNKLTVRQRILVAGTLFGMFFGAGNLIFPIHLGQLAGSNSIPAMIGFIITAAGVPILGVAAIAVSGSSGLQDLSSKVGKGYGYFFTCLLYLTIGPFFAIPRCASTSFSTGILPLLWPKADEKWALLIFSALFFTVVLLFSLKPGKITVWIGKIINPIFLVLLAVLIVTAFINPMGSMSEISPDASYESGAFFSGMIEGYGTMDAIAGLAFGIIVIDIIQKMGVKEDTAVAGEVLTSGFMTGILMAIIYVLTILIGAQSRGVLELSENGGIAFAEIFRYYYGSFGNVILAVTITLACLKTALGLVTSCAKTFSQMFNEKLSYKSFAVIFTLVSFAISNVGLSAIISISVPVLMFIYPLTITLILLAFAGKIFKLDRKVYITVTVFTGIAAVFDLMKALPESIRNALDLNVICEFVRKILPLYDINLGWIFLAVLGFGVGLLITFISRRRR